MAPSSMLAAIRRIFSLPASALETWEVFQKVNNRANTAWVNRFDITTTHADRSVRAAKSKKRISDTAIEFLFLSLCVNCFFGLLAANLAYSLVGHRHRHSIPAVIAVGVIALVGGQLVLDRVLGFGTELPVVIEFLGGVLFIILVLTGRAR